MTLTCNLTLTSITEHPGSQPAGQTGLTDWHLPPAALINGAFTPSTVYTGHPNRCPRAVVPEGLKNVSP